MFSRNCERQNCPFPCPPLWGSGTLFWTLHGGSLSMVFSRALSSHCAYQTDTVCFLSWQRSWALHYQLRHLLDFASVIHESACQKDICRQPNKERLRLLYILYWMADKQCVTEGGWQVGQFCGEYLPCRGRRLWAANDHLVWKWG